MFQEKGFSDGCVVSTIFLGLSVSLSDCRGTGFASGIYWYTMATSTFSNYADNILSDVFTEPVKITSWVAEISAYLMAAWFMKFWQMVMAQSSKSLVLVRTCVNYAASCLMRPYTVRVC